ncbi:hypothetical protein INH39_20155 [Massilia violaceinigra]|uniref:PEP-CTERM protein-sorting domain-containing protein n=1 Tax=Massilia violaceinigra TaxID=2045208 RepID=A0ABY3ZZ94_9BURK|nr:hypothetical protein [Massilia violaceinigra]UOD27798.1 hypothetical protein INH39_20155 [Massilia violaceinigra]
MNSTTRLLLIAALALSAASAPAQTPVRIDTAAFSIVNQWGDAPDTLLSDSNGVTRVGLNTASASLSADTARYLDGNFYGGLFEVTVNAGYRVTGFSFSGTFEGVLYVPPNTDGTPGDGFAYNSGYIELSAGSRPYGIFYGEHAQRVDMLDGAIPLTMASGELSLTTDFNLSLQGMVLVSAYPTTTPEHPAGIDSFASLRVVNPVFTIYTTAVPESKAWSMLLAGLGVLGSVAMRKKIDNLQDCQYDLPC